MELEDVLATAGRLPLDWIKRPPGEQLRALRSQLGMSQRHLADTAGFSHAAVGRLERGADARLSTWRRLFEALGFYAVLAPVGYSEEVEDLVLEGRDLRWLRQREPLRAANERRRR